MISAAIFDMDGTLADSERLGFKAWHMAADEMHIDIPHELPKTFIGFNRPTVLKKLDEYIGNMETSECLLDRHWEIRRDLALTELEPKPGVHKALEVLKMHGIAMAVATSSGRDITELNLARLGIRDYFNCLTCGTEVEHGKPDPEVFLASAQKLGVAPKNCIVVEDSANGVRAGHAAGMKVFLIPDMVPPTDEIRSLSFRELTTMADLPQALIDAELMTA